MPFVDMPWYLVPLVLAVLFGWVGSFVTSLVVRMHGSVAQAGMEMSAKRNAKKVLLGFWLVILAMLLVAVPDYSFQRIYSLIVIWTGTTLVTWFITKEAPEKEGREQVSKTENVGKIVASYKVEASTKITLCLMGVLTFGALMFLLPYLISPSHGPIGSHIWSFGIPLIAYCGFIFWFTGAQSVTLTENAITGPGGPGGQISIDFSQIDKIKTFESSAKPLRGIPSARLEFVWAKDGRRIQVSRMLLGDKQVDVLLSKLRSA